MKDEELIRVLQGFPSDHRLVGQCNVGYADIAVSETTIAANYRRSTRNSCGPLSYGIHATPDCIFHQIKASKTAVLIGLTLP
jgi:hypothetical protein